MPTVVYGSPFVPAEWIAAHGLVPRRILPRHAAGLSPEGAGDAHAGVCSYASAFAEAVRLLDCADAVVLATTCDQMRRSPDRIAACRPGMPVFLMNVPATWQTAVAQKMYADELARLGRFLCGIGGAAPSGEALAETMLRHDAARATLRGLRGSLNGARFAKALAALLETGEVEEAADVPAGIACERRGAQIALVGGPVLSAGFSIHETIERAGGDVVLDGTEYGERSLPGPLDRRRVREEPQAILAEAYFGAIPDVFCRPNSALYLWLKEEIAARGVRGIVFVRTLWCDLWHAEAGRMREWCAQAGLPLVDVDLNGDTGGEARAATRIQALLDGLK